MVENDQVGLRHLSCDGGDHTRGVPTALPGWSMVNSSPALPFQASTFASASGHHRAVTASPRCPGSAGRQPSGVPLTRCARVLADHPRVPAERVRPPLQ